MLIERRAIVAACMLSAAVSACGSGGGGGSLPSVAVAGGVQVPQLITPSPPPGAPGGTPAPGSGATPTPRPGATPTPQTTPSAPGGTPSPVPSGYFVQGTVRNFDTNAAIAGATVVVAPPVYAGSTPPPGVTTMATTAPDGSFTINPLVPGSNYIEVFDPGFATLHEKLNITSFNNQLGDVSITMLTSDQANWLVQLNAERAAWNAPSVVFDELLVEGARHWTAYMGANGWYQTYCPLTDPACQNAVQFETAHGGTYTATGSNIDGELPPSIWQTAERRFMAESTNCPAPVNPATCPNASAPEFLTLVNPTFIWAGLAELPNGKGPNLATPFLNYYDQEFATPIHQ